MQKPLLVFCQAETRSPEVSSILPCQIYGIGLLLYSSDKATIRTSQQTLIRSTRITKSGARF